ncbi:MAG: 30S ribosomal protein S3 [bacterium]|nr:30S ribosomal protein S3 [bacterium]
MGQKTHPYGFRLGITTDWQSKWFAKSGDFKKFLQEDFQIREYVSERLKEAGISKTEIERTPKHVRCVIHTARPGMVIGRKGALIDRLRNELNLAIGRDIEIAVQEIKDPEIDAVLVANNIARRLEQRVSFRRAMKRAMSSAMNLGALGIKIMCSGRLQGAEIARQEQYKEGKVPLHTLRAKIDYGEATSHTVSGTIGVKVWIYKGDN